MAVQSPVRSVLAGVAALLAAVTTLGLVFVAGPVRPAAIGILVLCTAFFAASAVPAVRSHPAYNLLNAGYTAVLFTLWYLVVRSSLGVSAETVAAIGVFAVLAVGGLLVELYNYRHGTSYLRLS